MSDALNIVVVTRGLPFHSLGGMEAVAWDLAREFARLGHVVTVLTTACKGLESKQVIDGVLVHCLNAPQGQYSRQWWAESLAVFKQEYQGKTNVVLSVSAGAMAIAKLQDPSIAYVVQAHGTSWGEFVSKLKQRTFVSVLKSVKNLIGLLKDINYRKFDAFIAIGEAVSKDLSSCPTKWIVSDLPVYLVPNGVNEDTFAFDLSARNSVRTRLGISDNCKVVFSACRLHEQKGVLEAIRGFVLAYKTDSSLRFIIAGDGPEKDKLVAIAKELNVEHVIHFVGSIQRDIMKDYLSAADLFLFTTKRVEGLPMNVLEALAAGLPVILSNHINHMSFNSQGVNPEIPGEISSAILNVQLNQIRKSKLDVTYTLENSAENYINIFQRVLVRK
ncbi:glycosyltransferase family 4 protein [Methylophilus glucosoxydans]|uniref:Glycosyltransferase family 4 protein n=1 Tax=Methylophilus glucosoxydans TaxID=752553 RepID=A0ABW3GI02_9PROT